jgi:hypothetical protein
LVRGILQEKRFSPQIAHEPDLLSIFEAGLTVPRCSSLQFCI